MRSYRKNWIISYDICDPRRLRRVYRLCCDQATSLQNSVFWAEFSRKELENFIRQLETEIDSSEDDVRIYPVSDLSQLQLVGQSRLPLEMEGLVCKLPSFYQPAL